MSSINGFGGDSRSMNGLTTFTGDTIDCDSLNAITVNAEEIYLDGDLLVYPQSVSFNAPFTITGNPGTNASVSDVITTANNLQTHQLTFTIPRGDPGDTSAAEAIANNALAAAESAEAAAEAAEIEAGLATVEAGAATITASTALGVATGAATAAGIAQSTANSAQSDANTGLSRTQYIRTTGSNYTVFTSDNRNQDPTFPEVYYEGGEGIRFYNKVITIDDFPTSFLQLRLTIKNNGDIDQEGGTTTLNNLVVNGSSTGVERLKINTDTTDTQFCIPYTRNIEINNIPPIDTRLGVDASFNFNPFTNTLSVPFITSDLSGSASKVLVSSSISTSDLPIAFLSSNTGAVDVLVDIVNGATYKASTNTLTCANFSGNLTGNVSGNLTGNVLGSTINIGDPASTGEINIEGRNNCNINIGIASFLNNVNIGNATSTVTIRCITDSAITIFNPFDQMNGVF